MSYKIKWLDNKFRHALVTEKRWFKPDRCTEVELKPCARYPVEVWFHYNSSIPVRGRWVLRTGYSEAFGGDGLQHVLWAAHIREIGRLRDRTRAELDALRDSEQEAQWREVAELPRACATLTPRCPAGCKCTCRHLVVTRYS